MKLPSALGHLAVSQIVACMLWSAPAGAAAVPVRPPPVMGTIPLFQSDNRVLVMMRIGDGELRPMVFDTGSDGHSFDRLLVRRDRMKTVGQTIELDGTTGTRRTLSQVAANNVSLGGLKVGNIRGVALDYDRDDAMGIISSEMFKEGLVYVELARNRVRLRPRDGTALPASTPTPYSRNLPAVAIQLPGGVSVIAELDTGYNGGLSLPVAMMDKIPLVTPAGIVGRFKSINSEGDVYGGTIRGTVRIGPVALKNPKVVFLGDTANLGLPVIRQLTLVLDPANQRSWVLDPNVAETAAPNAKSASEE